MNGMCAYRSSKCMLGCSNVKLVTAALGAHGVLGATPSLPADYYYCYKIAAEGREVGRSDIGSRSLMIRPLELL